MVNSKKIKQQAQEAQINQSIKSKFIPGFQKRKEAFDNAPAFRSGAKFPYIKEPIELAYDNFITDVVNPLDGSFHPPKDQNQIPISLPGGINCKKLVLKIIRIRLPDNSEKLVSFGQAVGYDAFGNRKVFTVDQPEKYNVPIFSIIRDWNPRKKIVESFCSGITGSKDVYELDFTPENVDMLYAQRPDPGSLYFRPNMRNFQNVALILKDHQNGGRVHDVFYNNIEESLKLFKEKDFDYLWRKDYLPLAIRQQMAMDRMGIVDPDKQVQQQSTTNNNRPGPNISNTSAYK